jgi:hypothetical protein
VSDRTYGPRFNGGYQFPRTNSAKLRRLPPIRVERLGDGAKVEVVPLAGSRERLYDVCGQWTAPDGMSVSSTFLAHDELQAGAEFGRLVDVIVRARQSCPDPS